MPMSESERRMLWAALAQSTDPSHPWLAEGERVTRQLEMEGGGYTVFYPWKSVRVFVTNARIMMLPPPGGTIRQEEILHLKNYFQIIELVDIRDLNVESGWGSKRTLRIEFTGGPCRTIESKESAITELKEALASALASRVPLVRFADPDEKVLFKVGNPEAHVTRDDVPGIESDVWRKTFALGMLFASAWAKPCITNQRILLYLVDNLARFERESFGPANMVYGAPVLRWVQIPLKGISKVYLKRDPLRKRIHLRLRGVEPSGFERRSLTMSRLGNEESAPVFNSASRERAASGRDLDVAFMQTSRAPWVEEQLVEALRGIIPEVVEIPARRR